MQIVKALLPSTSDFARTQVDEPVDLTGSVLKLSDDPVEYGGFCDIYKGEWSQGNSRTVVAMKMVRVYLRSDMSIIKRVIASSFASWGVSNTVWQKFEREIRMWSRLRHPNILDLYGTCQEGPRYFMVCPWQDNGHVLQYLKINPEANRRKIVCHLRFRWSRQIKYLQILEIAEALTYLHGSSADKAPVVHGDVKAVCYL
jgi:serine/threonine protein kinase